MSYAETPSDEEWVPLIPDLAYKYLAALAFGRLHVVSPDALTEMDNPYEYSDGNGYWGQALNSYSVAAFCAYPDPSDPTLINVQWFNQEPVERQHNGLSVAITSTRMVIDRITRVFASGIYGFDASTSPPRSCIGFESSFDILITLPGRRSDLRAALIEINTDGMHTLPEQALLLASESASRYGYESFLEFRRRMSKS